MLDQELKLGEWPEKEVKAAVLGAIVEIVPCQQRQKNTRKLAVFRVGTDDTLFWVGIRIRGMWHWCSMGPDFSKRKASLDKYKSCNGSTRKQCSTSQTSISTLLSSANLDRVVLSPKSHSAVLHLSELTTGFLSATSSSIALLTTNCNQTTTIETTICTERTPQR